MKPKEVKDLSLDAVPKVVDRDVRVKASDEASHSFLPT